MKNLFFCLGFLLLMTNCNKAMVLTEGEQSNNFEILYLSEYGGSGEEQTFIYTDASEFNKMWNETINSVSGSEEVPYVDFSEKMVVVKHFQSQNSGGNEFGIDSVEQADNMTTVHYTVISPEKYATMAITAPLMIVVVNKTSEPEVEFRLKRQ